MERKGLSAESSKLNAAILIQGNLKEATTDIKHLNSALTDSVGGYGFKVYAQMNATPKTALESIANTAAQVGPDGTLFIYLGTSAVLAAAPMCNNLEATLYVNQFGLRMPLAQW